jgi:predicted metalloprotease
MADSLDVLPAFTYYDDYDGPNAYASRSKFAPSSDGSVLFGKRLFLEIMSRPEHPDVGVTAVCAHEFGHVLQFKYGLRDVILRGQRTVKRIELHADFLAGYYAGRRKLQKADFPAAVFATQQESVGDFKVDQQHHGRPEERAAAVVRGFEVAYRERRTLSEAIQVGINYVSRL